MSESTNNICKYCGREWRYSYKVVYNDDGTINCYHDNDAFGLTTTDDERYHMRLLRREKILKEHEAGKLPKEYYRKDKETGEMSILPSHIYKWGY